MLPDLFLTFAKIGAFTFGGGYAMISMIEHACVHRKGWITHQELMDMTAIAGSTPGPIAINCATFTGYKTAGLPGALAATVGVILPSFLVIYVICQFLDGFLQIPLVANAFRGIKIAVGLLILEAGTSMLRKMERTALSVTVMACACVAMLCITVLAWDLSSVSLMLIAAAVSLSVYLLHRKDGDR